MAFNLADGQPHAAIDFGISNTDAVAYVAGEWRRWTRPYSSQPDAALVRAILAAGDVDVTHLRQLAVTGGRHRLLPPQIGQCQVIGVGELQAIGCGGQAVLDWHSQVNAPVLVVSAGSGTAIVAARHQQYQHVTGTGVGGGTMLGLSRLLLQTVDPVEINTLAQQGNPNGVDLSLGDVVTGPIGSLPVNATAVNFGRLARQTQAPQREDLAAALMTLIGQVIGLLAINAARAQQLERIVVIGHMADMSSFCQVLASVGQYYATPIELPAHAGYATALGALVYASTLA